MNLRRFNRWAIPYTASMCEMNYDKNEPFGKPSRWLRQKVESEPFVVSLYLVWMKKDWVFTFERHGVMDADHIQLD